MRRYLLPCLSILFLLIAGCQSRGLRISNPWIREVPPGITTTALYLTIKNNGPDSDTLLAVHTDIAGSSMIHRTIVKESGITSMEKVDKLQIPPSDSVTLEPGKMHIMLMGLKRNIKDGDEVKLVLEFEKAGSREITATVRGFKKD